MLLHILSARTCRFWLALLAEWPVAMHELIVTDALGREAEYFLTLLVVFMKMVVPKTKDGRLTREHSYFFV